MVTMIDEIFDRHYQAGREQLNAGLARGFGRFGRAIGMPSKCSTGSNIGALGNARPSAPAATDPPARSAD